MRLKQAKTSREESVEGRLNRLARYLNASERGRFDSKSLYRLRDYADTWLACSSAQEWCAKFPEHWQSITETLTQTQLVMHPFPGPTKNFIRAWDWKPLHVAPEKDSRRKLDKLFADFLSDSSDRLGVCKGCSDYFVKTPKRTDYCTEECKSRATAKLTRHKQDHLKWARITSAMKAARKSYAKDEISNEDLRREACMKTKSRTYVSFRWLNARVANRSEVDCEECSRLIREFLESERSPGIRPKS